MARFNKKLEYSYDWHPEKESGPSIFHPDHKQNKVTHHVCEEKPRVGQLEMLQQRVELHAVECAPGTMEILPRLRLLPRVVVVQKLVDDPRRPLLRPRVGALHYSVGMFGGGRNSPRGAAVARVDAGGGGCG